MSFEVPAHVRPIREKVRRFVEERIYPVEAVLDRGGEEARAVMRRLMSEAKSEGLWALGHPTELGGGLPFLDYV
jgi:alkylation response protein AidB-like acyl-CoA dehydrogenase